MQRAPSWSIKTKTQEIPALQRPRLSPDILPEHYTEAGLNLLAGLMQSSLQQIMPDSPYRDFMLWALEPGNPVHSTWIKMTGFRQIAGFAMQVMGSGYSMDDHLTLVDFAAPMTIYLITEIVSDNLAFGMNEKRSGDDTFFLRAHLMDTYNNMLCRAFAGEPINGEIALGMESPIAERISAFEQSLSPLAFKKVAAAYCQAHPQVHPSDLEYGLHPVLVANFNACLGVYEQSAQLITGSIVQRGLRRRYQTLARLLHAGHLSPTALSTTGIDTVLIVPVMAYYLEGVSHVLGLADRLSAALRGYILERPLNYAALLIRLTNDVGTTTLFADDALRAELMADLYHLASHSRDRTLHDFLRGVSSDYGPLLTRITRDVEHGDFNVMLHNLRHAETLEAALDEFALRLDTFATVYQQVFRRLERSLDRLTLTLDDDRLSEMVMRSVLFHEEMYRHDFTKPTGQGEYAFSHQ